MIAVALVVSFAAMVAVTVLTRRPPATPSPDLGTYLDRWSVAHDGYDARPTRVLRGWLTLMHRLARPIADAGVLPDVVTVWAVWSSLVVVALARPGGGWAIVAALLVVVSGLGDGLDGAVAVLTERASRWGYVLDSVADRVTEGLFLVAAWIVGAPAWLVVSTGAVVFLLEYLRARAGNAGADHVQTITVGERPSRIICCAIALALAGVDPARAPALAGWSIAILLALSLIALGQLAVPVRRQLR
ncbi:MAG TPA: CDP-alcohol phosphatidyltransferase family protein [Euzebyales bacterium]